MTLHFQEKTIIDDKILNLRHLILKGSNYEIGKKLGLIAKQQHNIQISTTNDQLRSNCQKKYMQKNYPIFFDRMSGIAEAYEVNIDDDQYDFSILGNSNMGIGCSAVYYPPGYTSMGHGIASRNLDFFPDILSRPYIVEMYPDKGYPSISVLSFELLGEPLEGINSEGLIVIHLADDESGNQYSMNPTGLNSVGFNELKTIQFLLDTCSNVHEAKQALLTNKHFYMFQPVHLLIADRNGDSFVWEFSHTHNKEYMVDGNNMPQIVTNFLLHRYQSIKEIPKISDDKGCPYNRYRTLFENITAFPDKFTLDVIKDINAEVFIDERSFLNIPNISVRTLMQNIYVSDTSSLHTSFLLREEIHPEQPNTKIAVRSEHYKFSLSC